MTRTPLQDLAEELFDDFRHRTRAPDARTVLIGAGLKQIARGMERVETRVQRSVWNIQRRADFGLHASYRGMERRSATRGVHLQMVVSTAAARHTPLLSSLNPSILVGQVYGPMLVIDASAAVIGGALDHDGQVTAWLTTDPCMVARAVDLWTRTRRAARPLLEPGTPPPLNPRQVEAAHLLCQGLSDRLIARRLGVSERTVASDLHRVGELLATGNRTALVAALSGRGDG